MSDMAAALADSSKLSSFEGLAVVQAGIEIPGAAGGLRDAMKIDPQEFHKGQRVFVVLECVVGKVRFDAIDKADLVGPQRRVHVFQVENATMVDGSLVSEQLAAQRDRIQRANDHAEGKQRIPFGDELQGDHDAGLHTELVESCPDCDAEAAAAAEDE